MIIHCSHVVGRKWLCIRLPDKTQSIEHTNVHKNETEGRKKKRQETKKRYKYYHRIGISADQLPLRE